MGFTYNKLGVVADALKSATRPEYVRTVSDRLEKASPGIVKKINLGVAAATAGGGLIGMANSDEHPVLGTVAGAGIGYTAMSIAAGIACQKKLL